MHSPSFQMLMKPEAKPHKTRMMMTLNLLEPEPPADPLLPVEGGVGPRQELQQGAEALDHNTEVNGVTSSRSATGISVMTTQVLVTNKPPKC